MLSVVSVDWHGPDTGWRLKLAHAATHIDLLAKVCNAYRAQVPQHVDSEPTDEAGRTAYRLYVDVPIPVEISLIVGDVLHNLRSALDTLAFALVVNDDAAGRALTEEEERSCSFPIYDEPSGFEDFFEKHGHRRAIMAQSMRDALRIAQPFYGLEYVQNLGHAGNLSHAEESPFHPLSTLALMSNHDKHRRLPVIALWPDIVHWGSDEPSSGRWHPGDGTFQHGSIVGYMVGDPGGEVIYEFTLTFGDPLPPALWSSHEIVAAA